MNDVELEAVARITQATFDSRQGQTVHRVRFLPAFRNDNRQGLGDLMIELSPQKGTSKPAVNLPRYFGEPVMDITYDPSLQSSIPDSIAESVEGVYAEEKAVVAQLFSTSNALRAPSAPNVEVPLGMTEDFDKRRTRSVKYASTYHLTFSLLTPEASPSDWEIKSALHETIMPLLQVLVPISNFTIDTQVQPYATFSSSIHPFFDEERKAFLLKSSDLGGFINAAEWPLSPSIGTGPTINFLLYVPAELQTPMLIDDVASTSWLILQWGGIVIYNPANPEALKESDVLRKEELEQPLLLFSQHLLDLLGLPSPNLPFHMRLSSQVRLLSLRLIASASSTLGSLARLVQELPSISIPKSTAESVQATLSHLDASCTALNEGRFQDALSHARIADEEAEKAFFHKSMVGQVYFPDEHKVAVYLPMLGPMAVPLIMSVFREVKGLKKGAS